MSERIQLFTSDEAFAAYSLPGSASHVLVSGTVQHLQDAGLTSGFLITPFERNHYSEPGLVISPDRISIDAPFRFVPDEVNTLSSTALDTYLDGAETLIDEIREGSFEKVVYSRIKVVPGLNGNLYPLFEALKSKYPAAFVFVFNIPGKGCWCGATPEKLVSEEDHSYYTMALAATQPFMGVPLNEVQWNDKEVHEQQVIVDYIEDVLNKNGHIFKKSVTRTMRAANVVHRCTDFTIEKDGDLLKLANALHPGPAICGLPQEEALEKIGEIEDHDRDFYCGYLGPYNIRGESCLHVMLRSMRVFRDHFALYLGGGITRGSDSMKEWEETELKAQALLSVFEKSLTD
jgi:isochorismate synthase